MARPTDGPCRGAAVAARCWRREGRIGAWAAVFAFMCALGVPPSRAQVGCIGDCDHSGMVTVAELIVGVNIALNSAPISQCPAFQSHGCQAGTVCVSALIAAVGNTLVGCPTPPPPTPTPTSTPSATPSATPTPTPEPRTSLRLRFHNPSASGLDVMASGTRVAGPPWGGAISYGPVAASVLAGQSDVEAVEGLAPGIWVHHVAVAMTGQQQHQQTLLVADSATPSSVDWTLFQTVLTVNAADDAGDGVCDATCTLRDAVGAAVTAPGPVLIRFDAAATSIAIANLTPIRIQSAGTVIDGTDASGNPSPVDDFPKRIYPTAITLVAPNANPRADTCPCQEAGGGALRIQAQNVELTGLAVRRQLAAEGTICCGDQDLIAFDSGSKDSRVATSLLDGGAAAITSAQVGEGVTAPATGKDCVSAHANGSTAAEPVTVANSELRFCYDRGAKSSNGFLRLERNWIHHNLRGGAFALSPMAGETDAGNIEAVENLFEQNGQNCPTANAGDCGAAQVVTRSQASELVAQGPQTRLQTTANIFRDGVHQGVFFQPGSVGSLDGDYVCGINRGSGGRGVEIDTLDGFVSDIALRGTAAAYSSLAGVQLQGNRAADLGTGGSAYAGRNAFAQNGRNVLNALDASAPPVPAQGNQWEHCYPASGATADACDVNAIGNLDTNNTMNALDKVDVRDPQPQQSSAVVQIAGVEPSAVIAGSVVHVFGTGFDAISGHSGGAGGNCRALRQGNSCNPLHGTCVEFLVRDSWQEADDVLAVTPTHLAVRAPMDCTAPLMMRVRRTLLDGSALASDPVPFCYNIEGTPTATPDATSTPAPSATPSGSASASVSAP